ncbi:MAG TPA: AAA family ATPase [Candidatus Saccharimonadales bacterium]|nr:AAA family ATPase [Candidatus Saccharimonadales bacterium]
MAAFASDPQAVLLNGLYGVGKSTVAVEMADRLEAAGQRYAALDLDWLAWGWASDGEPAGGRDDDHPTASPLLLEHLGLLVGSYRRRGNDRFVLAGSIASDDDLRAVRATLGMPLTVILLTASLEVVRERLAREPTSGRQDDARQTERWTDATSGPERVAADLRLDADRPVGDIAAEILDWLGWLSADPSPSD